MSAYDRWLEEPYTRAAADGAEYEAWCEREGLDPEGDHWAAWEDAKEAELEDEAAEDYERYMEIMSEPD